MPCRAVWQSEWKEKVSWECALLPHLDIHRSFDGLLCLSAGWLFWQIDIWCGKDLDPDEF